MSYSKIFTFLVYLKFFCPESGHANLKSLAKEFLHINSGVNQNRFMQSKSGLDVEILKGSKGFRLNANYNNIDDNQDYYTTNFTAPKKTESYNLTLSKPFDWGGEVFFKNSMTNTNQEKSTFISAYETNQFIQKLTYSQDLGRDFFGKSYRAQLQALEFSNKHQKHKTQGEIDKSLYNFFSAYTEAKLNKTLISFQEKSLARSIKRLKVIKRQVRDGLKDKVDAYEAEVNYHNSFESLELAKQRFIDSKKSLSTMLHRNINLDEIPSFDLNSKEEREGVFGKPVSNKNILAQKENVKKFRALAKKAVYDLNPDLKFSVDYQTNKYDPEKGDAFSDGKLGGDKKYWEYRLEVNFPLGQQTVKAQKSKAQLDLLLSEMSLRNAQNTLVTQDELLKNKIVHIRKSKNSAQKKRVLAEKALKAKNKLYQLGRRDLNDLIRSEENLISTETSLVNFMASYEKLLAEQALLYGKIPQYLELEN